MGGVMRNHFVNSTLFFHVLFMGTTNCRCLASLCDISRGTTCWSTHVVCPFSSSLLPQVKQAVQCYTPVLRTNWVLELDGSILYSMEWESIRFFVSCSCTILGVSAAIFLELFRRHHFINRRRKQELRRLLRTVVFFVVTISTTAHMKGWSVGCT